MGIRVHPCSFKFIRGSDPRQRPQGAWFLSAICNPRPEPAVSRSRLRIPVRILIHTLFLTAAIGTATAGNGKTTRIYLDLSLNACEKKEAHFYLEPAGMDGSTYKGRLYNKDGTLRAEGHYADAGLTIEHGLFIFYHPNGKVESTGTYEMGKKAGVWQRFDSWGRELAEKVYDPEPLKDILYAQAETMPQYPGGQKELVTYLKDKAIGDDGINTHGTMTATFVVEPNGSLSEVKVVGATNEEVEERVASALKQLPPWTPGQSDGLPVRVRVQVPVPY